MRDMALLKALICGAGLLLLEFVAPPAMAAEHDGQLWLAAQSKFALGDKWALDLEAEARVSNFADRIAQTQFKGTATRPLFGDFSAGAGYGHMITREPRASDVHENRLWQDLILDIGKLAGASLSVRGRLEQRFIDGDTGWRARSRIAGRRPFGDNIYAYGSGEVYFFLNDTDWGAQSGFEQVRFGAGFGFALSEKAAIEAGYLNRLKRVDGSEDEMSHIIGVTLKLSP